jgi:hypothetical protein
MGLCVCVWIHTGSTTSPTKIYKMDISLHCITHTHTYTAEEEDEYTPAPIQVSTLVRVDMGTAEGAHMEATFHQNHTVSRLYDLLAGYTARARDAEGGGHTHCPFTLYTRPPMQVLARDKTFREYGLMPRGRIYVKWADVKGGRPENASVLAPEALEKMQEA